MTRWQGDKPRPHHYEFAHRAVPKIALDARVDLAAIAGEGRLGPALRATWAALAERHDAADRLPDAGLSSELVEVAGQPAVLVRSRRPTMPLRHSSRSLRLSSRLSHAAT